MTWVWIPLLLLSYFYGFRYVYRRKYIELLNERYQGRLDCEDCQRYLKFYKEEGESAILCNTHARAAYEPVWHAPFIAAVAWPLLAVALYSCRLVKFVFFPRGVKAPAKLAWDLQIQEVELEKRQQQLEQAQRNLEVHSRWVEREK